MNSSPLTPILLSCVVVIGAAAACEAPAPEAGPCDAFTCDDYGAECGVVDDGCGQLLQCGTCDDDALCTSGTCVTPTAPQACVPGADVACACGGALVGAQTCLADGSGFDACRCDCDALDCADYGAECGVVDDGCGSLLQCGGCDADEVCADGTCQCRQFLVRDAEGSARSP